MPKHQVSIELVGNAGRLLRELDKSKGGVRRFGSAVRSEFSAIRRAAGSIQGQLAGIGVSLGAVKITRDSALLDKKLIQIGQTAGESKKNVAALRRELHLMAKKSGEDIDGLADGFNGLIQAGQSWKAAIESTKGINIASAVTGARGDVLAGGLTVGATAFDINLEKEGQALDMLDKMVVAGRLGNAELENLAAIFARVGVNANTAGLSFDKTLAFIETLSLVEKSPERLATLADSTLRLFTNMQYMAKAQKATKVDFFNADGSRRDPVAVLRDIKAQYDKMPNDLKQGIFMQKAFGGMDLDTMRGLRALFSGDSLTKTGEFTAQISAATGTLNRDFKDATDNLITQADRLAESLKEAADGFTKPMRDTLAEWIKFALDEKKLTGAQLAGGGLALAAGGIAATRYGGKGLKALLGKIGAPGAAAGIATGKAIEAATGVQPVFVTNWPGGSGGLSGGLDGATLKKVAPVLAMAGRATVGGAAMYGLNWSMKELNTGLDVGSMKKNWDEYTFAFDRLMEVFSGQRDWNTGELKQPTTIDMQVNIDTQTGRIMSESSDPGTRINPSLARGRFN